MKSLEAIDDLIRDIVKFFYKIYLRRKYKKHPFEMTIKIPYVKNISSKDIISIKKENIDVDTLLNSGKSFKEINKILKGEKSYE